MVQRHNANYPQDEKGTLVGLLELSMDDENCLKRVMLLYIYIHYAFDVCVY